MTANVAERNEGGRSYRLIGTFVKYLLENFRWKSVGKRAIISLDPKRGDRKQITCYGSLVLCDGILASFNEVIDLFYEVALFRGRKVFRICIQASFDELYRTCLHAVALKVAPAIRCFGRYYSLYPNRAYSPHIYNWSHSLHDEHDFE